VKENVIVVSVEVVATAIPPPAPANPLPAAALPGTLAVAVACVILSGEELPIILRATSDIIYVFVVLEVE
jgi:hypothetical protein